MQSDGGNKQSQNICNCVYCKVEMYARCRKMSEITMSLRFCKSYILDLWWTYLFAPNDIIPKAPITTVNIIALK